MKGKPLIPLWPDEAPGALGNHPQRDVPTLTCYFPDEIATVPRAAMVICPGGGYWELMDGYEGRDYALWLNELGIVAFVLTYRIAQHGYHYPAMTDDLTRAIRLVRANASHWQLDPHRVGVMGSSAGGHLASVAMTLNDEGDPSASDPVERQSSRPDLGVLCYPVISMEMTPMEHLLGEAPGRDVIRTLSSNLQVTSETPPCFLWHTQNDPIVRVEHAFLFAESCQRNQVSLSFHLYHTGAHGQGLGVHGYNPEGRQPLHPWTAELQRWLVAQDFSEASPNCHPAHSTLAPA